MVTFWEGVPDCDPTASTAFTTFFPSLTRPNTTWRPSSQLVLAVVIKNWLPLVPGPAFAIDRQKGSCLSLKFSSQNFEPQMDSPPVPSPRVKSPPWIMKLGMMRWKLLPQYFSALPFCTMLPSQRETKFLTVFGTAAPNMSMTMSPADLPPMLMEKTTWWVTVS